MTHHTNTRLLVALLFTISFLAPPGTADANQVYNACGKKWFKKAQGLPQEQLDWTLKGRTATLTKDLDGDGGIDTLTVQSTATFRDCDLEKTWNKKETTVRIDYADGKSKVFYWIDGGLVQSLKSYRGLSRILVVGVDARGKTTNRWVETGRASATAPAILSVDSDPPPDTAEAEAFQIASIQ